MFRECSWNAPGFFHVWNRYHIESFASLCTEMVFISDNSQNIRRTFAEYSQSIFRIWVWLCVCVCVCLWVCVTMCACVSVWVYVFSLRMCAWEGLLLRCCTCIFCGCIVNVWLSPCLCFAILFVYVCVFVFGRVNTTTGRATRDDMPGDRSNNTGYHLAYLYLCSWARVS